MEGVMFITLLDSKQLFWKILQFQHLSHDGMWKPKGCDLVVLGLCDKYAKGLLRITFHSSKVTIFVTAGSAWIRVKRVQKVLNFFAPNSLRENGST